MKLDYGTFFHISTIETENRIEKRAQIACGNLIWMVTNRNRVMLFRTLLLCIND